MPYQVKADAGRKEHEAQANGAAVHKLMGPVPVSDVDFIGRLEPTVHQLKPANKVTPEQIQALATRVIYMTAARLMGTTSTFVHAYLDGKFYLASGHSACVDPANFDSRKGIDIAQRNCEYAVNQKLWELEGYALWKNLQ